MTRVDWPVAVHDYIYKVYILVKPRERSSGAPKSCDSSFSDWAPNTRHLFPGARRYLAGPTGLASSVARNARIWSNSIPVSVWMEVDMRSESKIELDRLEAAFKKIVADAVAGRGGIDHSVALERMANSGAVLLTAESVLFEWCETADAEEFKRMSALVKGREP